MGNKDRVIQWVRSKNPQTIERSIEGSNILAELKQYVCLEEWLSQCPDEHAFMEGLAIGAGKEIGSNMGLQELLIAFKNGKKYYFDVVPSSFDGMVYIRPTNSYQPEISIDFDLTKNLHEQSEEFFESIFPLIDDE